MRKRFSEWRLETSVDFGLRIADLKVRCWILDTRCSTKIYRLLLAPNTSSFGGPFFSHHKGTKPPRLNMQKISHHSSNLRSWVLVTTICFSLCLRVFVSSCLGGSFFFYCILTPCPERVEGLTPGFFVYTAYCSLLTAHRLLLTPDTRHLEMVPR